MNRYGTILFDNHSTNVTVAQFKRVIDRIAEIADAVQAKLKLFVIIGLFASTLLAWKVFSFESAIWWNGIKCGLVLMPAMVWVFAWFVFRQLRDAPKLVAELVDDKLDAVTQIRDFKEPVGLRGLFTSIRELRSEDGLGAVFDTVSGITLIANPVFAVLACFSLAVLLVLIVITPFVMLL